MKDTERNPFQEMSLTELADACRGLKQNLKELLTADAPKSRFSIAGDVLPEWVDAEAHSRWR